MLKAEKFNYTWKYYFQLIPLKDFLSILIKFHMYVVKLIHKKTRALFVYLINLFITAHVFKKIYRCVFLLLFLLCVILEDEISFSFRHEGMISGLVTHKHNPEDQPVKHSNYLNMIKVCLISSHLLAIYSQVLKL